MSSLEIDYISFSTESNVYGYELVIDLKNCNVKSFNRTDIDNYFTRICAAIDMEKCEIHFWDDIDVPEEDRQTAPHTKGTSAVCFILTSTIVIHTLDLLASVYVNIFSCKNFDPDKAVKVTKDWFEGTVRKATFLHRY